MASRVGTSWITEALVIASFPVFSYLIYLSYVGGVEDYFHITWGFAKPTPFESVGQIITTMLFLLVAWGACELLSYLIPKKDNHPVWLRVRRVLPLTIALCFFAWVSMSLGQPTRWTVKLGILAIFVAPLFFALLAGDFLAPLFRNHGQGSWLKRLRSETNPDDYATTLRYIASRQLGIVIMLALIILFYVLFFAQSLGYSNAESRRTFIVIESSPKLIVLIDYGEQLLAARFDEETYPDKPAYHPVFRLIDQDELSKTDFRYRRFDTLYRYDN